MKSGRVCRGTPTPKRACSTTSTCASTALPHRSAGCRKRLVRKRASNPRACQGPACSKDLRDHFWRRNVRNPERRLFGPCAKVEAEGPPRHSRQTSERVSRGSGMVGWRPPIPPPLRPLLAPVGDARDLREGLPRGGREPTFWRGRSGANVRLRFVGPYRRDAGNACAHQLVCQHTGALGTVRRRRWQRAGT